MDINPLYPTVIPLTCPVTHYEWGAPGLTSLAARLYSMNSRACLSATKPYAEFVVSSHEPHTAVISTSPPASLRDYIGSQVIEVDPSIVQFYSRLYEDGAPFILKVISAATPTGVRVHPDDSAVTPSFEKSSFARLGSKSIMVFALGTTHVLVGFHPATKIVAQLTRVPEFADAIGRSHTDQFVHIVKSSKPTASHVHHIVATLLAQNPTTIAYCIRSAVSRLAKMPVEVVTDDDRMLIALANIFPDDPMCFVAYLLDRLQLNPGDAIFIPPTKPYCILNGDFVEVSEKTDSVYFAGLTATDRMRAGQFLQTVSFTNFSTEILKGEQLGDYGKFYSPPVPEFQLGDFNVPNGMSQKLTCTLAPTIILVFDGEGFLFVHNKDVLLPLHVGSVLYLNPQTQFTVTSRPNSKFALHFVRVGVNEAAASNSSVAACTIA